MIGMTIIARRDLGCYRDRNNLLHDDSGSCGLVGLWAPGTRPISATAYESLFGAPTPPKQLQCKKFVICQ